MAKLIPTTYGDYTSPDMKGCPFCGNPVTIEYNGFTRCFDFRHKDVVTGCPLHRNKFTVDAGDTTGKNTYDVAIALWNMRAE